MTRVAVVSANLGAYDHDVPWPTLEAPLGVEVSVHRFTDANLPPRPMAMTPRLQCGLLKWFGYEFVPGADLYLWIDASCVPTAQAVPWFCHRLSWVYDRLQLSDLALFAHPDRQTIRQEYEFMRARLAHPGERYLTSRYRGEWLDEQFAMIADAGYAEAQLFASTAFMYRPSRVVRELLKEVWYGKTRWHLHDQLYLAYAVAQSECTVSVIRENYLKCPALTYIRNRK